MRYRHINDSCSATRPARRVDSNRSVIAGFAEVHRRLITRIEVAVDAVGFHRSSIPILRLRCICLQLRKLSLNSRLLYANIRNELCSGGILVGQDVPARREYVFAHLATANDQVQTVQLLSVFR